MSRSNQLAGLLTADPPSALDTINEINTALGNDGALATTLADSIATKASKSGDTFTGNVAVTQGSSNNSNLKVETTGTGHAEVFLKTPNRQYNIGLLNNGSKFQLYDVNAGANRFEVDTSGNFFVNSGKVGIGTTSTPSQKLEISDSATVGMQIRNLTNSGYSQLVFGTGSSASSFCIIRHERVGADQGKLHITKPNDGSGGNAFTIDHNGNVGIGVAPEAVDTNYIALQIAGTVGLQGTATQGAGSILALTNNVYRATDQTWKYIVTDEASRYDQFDGGHVFRVAGSGTADATISFTDALTINSSGVVTIGNQIYSQAFRTLFLDRDTTLNINPYTDLGVTAQGGAFYVSFSTWAGRAGLFQVRWNNAGGNGGITAITYDTIVNGGGGLGLTVSHTQNNNLYDSVIHITSSGHHSNKHGWTGGIINFGRYGA